MRLEPLLEKDYVNNHGEEDKLKSCPLSSI